MGLLCLMRAQGSSQNPRDASETMLAEEGEGAKIRTWKCPCSAGTEVIDHHPSDGGEEVGWGRTLQVVAERARGLAPAKIPCTGRRRWKSSEEGESKVRTVHPTADVDRQDAETQAIRTS